LYSCGCSLLFQISVLKHLDVSSISPSASVNFKAVMVVSSDWDSDFLGSFSLSRALYFRISKRWSSVTSSLWQFSKSKTSSVTSVQTNALGLMYWVWEQMT
jgi:hypothetical protein